MQKGIFKYTVRGEEFAADPVEAERELIVALNPECGGDIFETGQMARTHDDKGQRVRPDAQAFKYRGYLVAAFREVFKLPKFNPVSQEGILEDEVWRLMDEFWAFRAKKKENTVPLPTYAGHSVSHGLLPTTSITDSGSTPNAV
jgi:hypothetical protein